MSDELIEGSELRSRSPQPPADEPIQHPGPAGIVALPKAVRRYDEPSHPYVVLEPPEEAGEFLDREVGEPTRPSLPTVVLESDSIEGAPAEEAVAEAPESPAEPAPIEVSAQPETAEPLETAALEDAAPDEMPSPAPSSDETIPDPSAEDSSRLMRLPRIKIEAETEEPAEIPQEAEEVSAVEQSAPESPEIVETLPEPPDPEPAPGQLTPVLEFDPVVPEPDEAAEPIHIHEATPGEEIVTGEFAEAVPDLNWDAVIDGESPEIPAEWEPYAPPEEPSPLAALRAVFVKRALPIAVLIVMAAALIIVPIAIRRARQSAATVPPRPSEKPPSTEEAKESGVAAGPTRILQTASPIGPTPTALPPWAQGRIVYSSNADGDFDLVRLDFATGVEKTLTVNDAADRSPAWSPDGRRIVYVSDLFGTDNLFLINADGTNLVQLTSSFALDHNPEWSPDGQSILFSREDVNGSSLILLDTACIEDDPPQSCEDALSVVTTGSYDLFPEWSPDGSRIAFANSAGPGDPLRIALIAASGSGFTALPGTNSSDFAPVWSPDGSRLLFVSYLQGDDDVWMMNPDGSNVIQITGSLAIDASPTWSPDGAWIAFASDRGPAGDFDLYVIRADCTTADPSCEEAARHITTDPADELDVAWAP